MKKSRSCSLFIAILIPLAVGSISSLFSSGGMADYAALNKPAFSPPSFLFPVVWTLLYILMGISSYLICRRDTARGTQKKTAMLLYAAQLFFNFFWSILFFSFSAYFLAFVWLMIMDALILFMILAFYRIDWTAACLQIPYLIWCLFAACLNLAVVLMNA